MEFAAVIASAVTIFVIMDPFASLVPFLAFTKKCKDSEAKHVADKAVFIAGILALIFVFGGMEILNLLSVTLADFKVAGGIVLILLGLENVLSFSLSSHKDKQEGLESLTILIATPLLTGPGLITTLVLLVKANDVATVIVSLLIALFLAWIILRNAFWIRKILGDRVIMVISKIIGLILMVMGVAYLRAGILGL